MWKRLLAAAAIVAATACGSSNSTTSPTSTAPFSATDLTVGTGATAAIGNTVTVTYTGWLYDTSKTNGKGNQFDSSASFSFVLGAGQVIRGWDQGVPGMKVGGQRRLIIPPDLAYGSQGSSNGAIPGNATLIFDVGLIAVK